MIRLQSGKILIMSKRIVESYKRKLNGEEGVIIKRGASLRIALCYPNTHADRNGKSRTSYDV